MKTLYKKGDLIVLEVRGPRGGKRKPQTFRVIAVRVTKPARNALATKKR